MRKVLDNCRILCIINIKKFIIREDVLNQFIEPYPAKVLSWFKITISVRLFIFEVCVLCSFILQLFRNFKKTIKRGVATNGKGLHNDKIKSKRYSRGGDIRQLSKYTQGQLSDVLPEVDTVPVERKSGNVML